MGLSYKQDKERSKRHLLVYYWTSLRIRFTMSVWSVAYIFLPCMKLTLRARAPSLLWPINIHRSRTKTFNRTLIRKHLPCNAPSFALRTLLTLGFLNRHFLNRTPINKMLRIFLGFLFIFFQKTFFNFGLRFL